MSNQHNCILGQIIATKNGVMPACKYAAGDKCSLLYPEYTSLHGFSGLSGRIGAANIPPHYKLITAQTSPARTGQPKVYRLIDKYVESFKKMFDENLQKKERIKSLYLYSEKSGTGKTATAVALLNEYSIRHFIGSLQRGVQPKQNIAYFLDVNEWQETFVGFNQPNVPQNIANEYSAKFYEQMEMAKNCEFVALDDMAVRTNPSDAFRGKLHSIINHRVNYNLPTIYTSNVPIASLPSIFGEQRLYDRVRDLCLQVDFEGESNRGMSL